MLKKFELILMFFVICGSNFFLQSYGYGFYSAYLLLPLTFLYFFFQSKFQLRYNNFLVLIFIFFLWGCISSIFGINYEMSLAVQRRLLLVLIYSYIIFYYGNKSFENIQNIFVMHNSIIYFAFLYILSFDTVLDINSDSRLSFNNYTDFAINANTYGYFAFTALASSFSIHIIKATNFSLLNFIITSALSMYVVILSASRGGSFVLFLLLILFIILYILNKEGQNKFAKIFTIFISLIFALFLIIQVLIAAQESFLFVRIVDQDIKYDARILHFFNGIKVGFSNFFLGVGAGNYSLIPNTFDEGFSHNSFVEAFANHGFFGLIIYTLFIRELFTKPHSLKNSYLWQCYLVVLICFIAYNFLYVTYLSNLFMGFISSQYLMIKKIDT